jgi:hypothetical protein
MIFYLSHAAGFGSALQWGHSPFISMLALPEMRSGHDSRI